MDIISIKVHPPWYARGTPIINPRDGPPMALSDKPLFAIREGPSARGKPPDNMWPWLTLKIFNTVNLVDADRACPDPSGSNDAVRSGERSEVAAVHFDLSACAAPDNVKMIMDNVNMADEERSVVSVSVVAAVKFDADRSIDAVRSEERSAVRSEERSAVRSGEAAVYFDLSAFAEPDNVKMEWDNVKMIDEERSAVSVSVVAAVKFDADRSIDAVRSEERSAVRSGEAAVHFDLSACAVPDNVKMVMDNVKMLDDDTIDIYILKRTKIK